MPELKLNIGSKELQNPESKSSVRGSFFDFRLTKPKTNDKFKINTSAASVEAMEAKRKTTLEPILENQAAHIAHLKKPVNEYIKMFQ